ncbi:MAG: hypothetical protein C4324_05370 [Blastocatellia bacterium]
MTGLIFVVAMLYSSVGHGGASGYLAMLSLFGVAATTARPTALILNLFVSAIAATQYIRKGFFSFRLFAGFAVASVPLAFIGGMLRLPFGAYRAVLGVVLLVAAIRLATDLREPENFCWPNLAVSVIIGAAIGFVSGLVGVGGGIFLTPILLFMKWADAKTAAGVSALFIFVNSLAALVGMPISADAVSQESISWLAAALLGGLIGSRLGAGFLRTLTLRRLLAAVLVVAAAKLFFV